MNIDKVRHEVNEIVVTIRANGWKMNKPTKKALRRLEELGLTEFVGVYARADVKGDAIVNAVIAAAEDKGGKRITSSNWNIGGDADVTSEVTQPSPLYLALNEVEQTEPTPGTNVIDCPANDDNATFTANVDAYSEMQQYGNDVIEVWQNQPAPAPETLTDEDVMSASLALDVLDERKRSAGYYSGFNVHFAVTKWTETPAQAAAEAESVKRGFAILNGYKLVRGERTPIDQPAAIPDGSVVSRFIGGGFTALTEYHTVYGLVPIGALMSISEAAAELFGENSQNNRMRIVALIERGELNEYLDRSVPNPQHRRKVARGEVEKLKTQSG
jgi:hypothetical protein